MLLLEFSCRKTKKSRIKNLSTSVVLVDTRPEDLLVHGIAAVPDSFGAIESAVLIVVDESGRRLCRAALGAQRLSHSTSDFEFNIRRELLAKSYILVAHRDGEDLHLAKFLLGSFHVRNSKK